MQINSNTTLQELFNNGIISVRTQNILLNIGIETIEDLLSFAKEPEDLLKITNFGKKAYNEVAPIIQEIRKRDDLMSQQTANSMFEALSTDVRNILTDVFEALSHKDSDITNFFKKDYPTVALLHSTMMNGNEATITINERLNFLENIELRRMYALYLDKVINRLEQNSLTDNDVCVTYKERAAYLSDKIESFSYEDKVKYFMTDDARKFFQMLYVEMRNKQNMRTKSFLEEFAPDFQALLPLFNEPLERYKILFPGKHLNITLAYVFDFNGLLKMKFDHYWQINAEEVRVTKVKNNFPYLNYSEQDHIIEYKEKHGIYPLFYVLHKHMCLSTDRNNKIFSLLYGIADGKEHSINEVAEIMNLTCERIRQLTMCNVEVHKALVINNEKWKHYNSLLSLPYVTEETKEVKEIMAREGLEYDFSTFARLMQLLGSRNFKMKVRKANNTTETINIINQYETRHVGETFVVVNRKKMPKFKPTLSAEILCTLLSARYSCDSYVDLNDCLGDISDEERILSLELLLYIGRKMGLNIDENNRIFVPQNYIDVKNEIYDMLVKKGEPMSLNEIFDTFKSKYPDFKYKEPENIRRFIFENKHIKAIGNSSCYGLEEWDNVYFGTIRELLISLLEASDDPIHLKELYKAVKVYYPKTTLVSLDSSMKADLHKRFIAFQNRFFGLRAKTYDKMFKEWVYEHVPFESRIREMHKFIAQKNRFPVASKNEKENSLYNWYHYIRVNIDKISPEERAELEGLIKHYHDLFVPRNLTEHTFFVNCKLYKAFVEKHHVLATITKDEMLYNWFKRSRSRSQIYKDFRQIYMDDLYVYLRSQGINI
jgi:hypothetical protein